MKLQKREITLNEKDSMQDLFYLERTIEEWYAKAEGKAFRKETENELKKMLAQAKEDRELAHKLWRSGQ